MHKAASLPDDVLTVVQDKGTEHPYSGEYDDFEGAGTYLCRQCGLALFRSKTKFHSGCGWPSFDEEIANTVLRQLDMDGLREEILCTRCHAHLGHVFKGEGFTNKDTRHCVNSLSLDFVANDTVLDTEEAIFAAGCFWGVEYLFKQLPGVLKTEVGYTGGKTKSPSYHDVCSGAAGHCEAVRVVYDPALVSYEEVTKYFFEIHDATQANGQGPDLGTQYHSAIFYYNEMQKRCAEEIILILKKKGYKIVTWVLPISPFFHAEAYHQDYYSKNNHQPYCHRHNKIFD